MITKFNIGQSVCAISGSGEQIKFFKIGSIVIKENGNFYLESNNGTGSCFHEMFIFTTEEDFKETLKKESKQLHEYIFWR